MLALGYILLTCYAYMYPYYKKKKDTSCKNLLNLMYWNIFHANKSLNILKLRDKKIPPVHASTLIEYSLNKNH